MTLTTKRRIIGSMLGILMGLAALPDEAPAQGSWRGLVVAPENRCAPYDRDDYRYPQSVEDEIVASLGGFYGSRSLANQRPV